jgi:hypothetical protein
MKRDAQITAEQKNKSITAAPTAHLPASQRLWLLLSLGFDL